MCIYVYMCTYVYICVHMCIYVYMCVYVYICVHMCIYVYICVYMCMYALYRKWRALDSVVVSECMQGWHRVNYTR